MVSFLTVSFLRFRVQDLGFRGQDSGFFRVRVGAGFWHAARRSGAGLARKVCRSLIPE